MGATEGMKLYQEDVYCNWVTIYMGDLLVKTKNWAYESNLFVGHREEEGSSKRETALKNMPYFCCFNMKGNNLVFSLEDWALPWPLITYF